MKATHYPFSEAADRGFVSLLAAVMHGARTAPVSGGQHGPSLAVTGAPAGSQLFVDGKPMGEAAVYDGRPRVLLIEAGTHLVDVRDKAGRVLFEQTLFVESETKTIQVQ